MQALTKRLHAVLLKKNPSTFIDCALLLFQVSISYGSAALFERFNDSGGEDNLAAQSAILEVGYLYIFLVS